MNSNEKLNVLQQSSTSNIEQKRQIIIYRKSSEEDILLTNPGKKRTKPMTRIHNPPPVAVARRNARERNRVKQVNNGFATLRQHIPTAIAASYESGNGRGTNKKLSKVETLRMAVEYIKSLEKLLSLSDENTSLSSNNSSISNFTSNNIPSTISVPSQFNVTYTYESKTEDERLKKTYLMYEDEENIHPLKMEEMHDDLLSESTLVSTNLDSNDMTLLNSIDNTASLSPEVYSEHSLSPVGLETNDSKSFIPVFNVPNQNILPSFSHIVYDRLPQVKPELLSPTAQQNVDDTPGDSQTVCIIARNEDENSPVMDVLWWDQQQQTS